MYSDKNPLYSLRSERDIPPRVPVGRSCPTFAKSVNDDQNLPRIDERQSNRLCDGSLPKSDLDLGMNGCGNSNHGGCGNRESGWGIKSYPLAMVYSPLQEFRELYDMDIALERGTIFAELDLPFEGRNGEKGGCKLC